MTDEGCRLYQRWAFVTLARQQQKDTQHVELYRKTFMQKTLRGIFMTLTPQYQSQRLVAKRH